MALLPGPANVQMYFVEPHVKRGDYYLMINPITGRRMWVYPRMMGERHFPVVSALGSDEAAAAIAEEAAAAAAEVGQQAQETQAQSQSVPPRAPVENAVAIPEAGTANKLYWIGLGAVAVLGVAYFLMKKEDES